jgi:chromosomal replication initiation ATPase DnaA
MKRDISQDKLLAANTILVNVAAAHGVTIPAMMGDGRQRDVVAAREQAILDIYLAVGLSSPQIGSLLNKHHTAILRAMRRARPAA